MLSSQVVENPEKDVRNSTANKQTIDEDKLHSINQHTLNEIYRVIGGKQMTRSKMSCAPDWILDKALQEELKANWKDTHDVVDERDIEEHANFIPSHVLYEVKNEEKRKKNESKALSRP